MDNNHRTWHSIGVFPFIRKVCWELIENDRAWSKACSKVHLDASKLNVQDVVQTTFATDNREELVVVTTRTTRMTSSRLWSKGPITCDVCFLLMRRATEERKAAEDWDARRRQHGDDEMQAQAQDACILVLTLTRGLTWADKVYKWTVEQLGAILLSLNGKIPKGKAAMVEAVLGCRGLSLLVDRAPCSSHLARTRKVHTVVPCLPPLK